MTQIVEYEPDPVVTVSSNGVTYRPAKDFVSAVVQSMSKLLNNPVLFLLYMVAVLDMCDIAAKKQVTLLHYFISSLTTAIASTKSEVVKSVLQACLYLLQYIANYEVIFVGQVFVWIPASFKMDSSSFVTTVIMSFVTVVFTYFSLFETFLLGIFWYLFTELIFPIHKIYLVLIFMASLYIKVTSTKNGVNVISEHFNHILGAMVRFNYSVYDGYDPDHVKKIFKFE